MCKTVEATPNFRTHTNNENQKNLPAVDFLRFS